MEAEFEADSREAELTIAQDRARDKVLAAGKKELGEHRQAEKTGKRNSDNG